MKGARATKEPTIKKLLGSGSHFSERFISDYRVLAQVVKKLREFGYQIVLTQGVYDLIHEGHALYLEKARSHGDILIVGVDSDDLTRKRKGPNRPIVPQEERLKMLVQLRHVDIVTLRHLHHPLGKLIEIIKPDVLIASETTSDFTQKDLAKLKKFCKKVVTLPAQATTSTTARIRNLTIHGAQQFLSAVMDSIPRLYKDIFRN